MSKEAKETVNKFLGHDVTVSASGKEYAAKQEVALGFFKERGFSKDTVSKFFDTIHDIQMEAAEFCKEKVIENKTDARLNLPVKSGVNITGGVTLRRFYNDGIPKTDENGETVKPDKKAHYGGVNVGIKFTVTKPMKEKINGISTAVEEACKAHCEALDKEEAKKTA